MSKWCFPINNIFFVNRKSWTMFDTAVKPRYDISKNNLRVYTTTETRNRILVPCDVNKKCLMCVLFPTTIHTERCTGFKLSKGLWFSYMRFKSGLEKGTIATGRLMFLPFPVFQFHTGLPSLPEFFPFHFQPWIKCIDRVTLVKKSHYRMAHNYLIFR